MFYLLHGVENDDPDLVGVVAHIIVADAELSEELAEGGLDVLAVPHVVDEERGGVLCARDDVVDHQLGQSADQPDLALR